MSDDEDLSPEELELYLRMNQEKEERKKLLRIAEQLKIPCMLWGNGHSDRLKGEPAVLIRDLWEILSDETKLKELLSRLKLKAFW